MEEGRRGGEHGDGQGGLNFSLFVLFGKSNVWKQEAVFIKGIVQ